MINSLPIDLREEILRDMAPDQLEALPQNIREEAVRIQNSFRYHDLQQFEQREIQRREEVSRQKLEENKLKQMLQKKQMQEKKNLREVFVKDKQLQQKLPPVDEKLIQGILKMLYTESYNLVNFPLSLLKAIITHPVAEYKVLDCLLFILKNRELP